MLRKGDAFTASTPLLALLILLGFGQALFGAAAAQATATSVQSVRSGSAPASPVKLRGIVTAFSGWKNSFFLQDATGAISVDRTENAKVLPGDEVEVDGRVRPGLFAPILISDQVRVLSHRGLPPAQEADYEKLSDGRLDSRLVRVNGIVQAARAGQVWGRRVLFLTLHTPKGTITVHVLDFQRRDPSYLIDSVVRVEGVCGTVFNDRQQLVGLRLFVSDLDHIEVVKQGAAFSQIPLTPLGSVLRFDGPSLEHRIKVAGVVSYRESDKEFFLQEGNSAIRIETMNPGDWRPGVRVHAAGFVVGSAFMLTMHDAVVEHALENERGIALTPVHIAAADAIRTEDGFVQAPYNGRLVELRGRVLEFVPMAESRLLQLRSGNARIQARWQTSPGQSAMSAEPGSEVSVTGICLVEVDENQNPKSFQMLLRSPDDVHVLNAPYWSSSVLLLLLIALLISLGSLGLWLFHRRRSGATVPGIDVLIPPEWRRNSGLTARGLALLSLSVGASVVVGWLFDIRLLELRDIRTPIMPNAGAGILAASLAILLTGGRRRWHSIIRRGSTLLCIAIGVLTLFEYATSLDIRIDTLLIRNPESLPQTLDPGRMAIATAACLVLTGIALAFINRRRWAGIGQVVAIATAVISLLNLVTTGLYGGLARYGVGAHATMALPTALAFVILSLSLLFLRADWGAMQVFLHPGSGGLLARRMLPVALVCPLFLGWIRLQGQIAGWYDTRFGIALLALSNVVSFGFLIWSCADTLNGLDAERSAVERHLKDRDRRLEMAFDAALVGDWTWDAVRDEVMAHPVVWKLYGDPTHSGTEPASWFQGRQHPDDVERVDAELAAAIAEHRALDIEFRVMQADGSFRWICCRAKCIYGASGELLRTTGINFDVTDRRHAEDLVKKSEERFRQLADAMPQIVWTARPDGYVEYYNRRWFHYTGLSSETAWEESVHPEDVEICSALFKEALEKGSPFQAELRIYHASGEVYRWHLARAIPIRDASGAIERWFGTSTDIDDFKRASAELKVLNESLETRVQERSKQLAESESQYRLLLGSVKDYAILMLDESGVVVSWNVGAKHILGYTQQEIVGKHFSIFYTEEGRQLGYPERELALARQTGGFEEEGLRINKDGREFWASVAVTPVWNEDGSLRGFSKVTRDISARRNAEDLAAARSSQLAEANTALMSQTQRAEEANRAKSSFLASMSHEIRTPMNAILGMADLLWETELNAVQREYVARFRRAGGSLLSLINDILDLSKIESGYFELEAVDFDLHELVERTVELIDGRARVKHIELVASVSPGTPRFVVCDPVRLQQILNNLVGNAVKFTERGRVTLTVRSHADQRTGHFQFEVKDTGIGIAPDKLAAIFEDFTQAESSTTRRFGGTGLGLAICRRLVTRMGGQLSVESQLGEGSTFLFDLILPVLAVRPEVQATDAADLTGCRVLIVDDNSTNRLILREMCLGWGMRSRECANASDATRQIREGIAAKDPFSLVLLDCVMPNMDGLQALAVLHQVDRSVPVILVSSDSTPGEATKAKASGAAAYIAKPVRTGELIDLISKVLGRKSPSEARSATVAAVAERPKEVMKILVAEDSEDNRFLLAAYLKNGPYEAIFAKNGQEALDLFSKQDFDLTLMDVQMPVMDGLTAAAAIRALERERSTEPVPIVALTANALREDIELSQAAGCDAHLSKPISKERLVAAIEGFRSRSGESQRKPEQPLGRTTDYAITVPEGLEELSRRYVATRSKEISHMMSLANAGQMNELRVFGHNMKGTGTSYGFPELTQLGAAIEEAAKRSDSSSVIGYLREVNDYIEYARGVLA